MPVATRAGKGDVSSSSGVRNDVMSKTKSDKPRAPTTPVASTGAEAQPVPCEEDEPEPTDHNAAPVLEPTLADVMKLVSSQSTQLTLMTLKIDKCMEGKTQTDNGLQTILDTLQHLRGDTEQHIGSLREDIKSLQDSRDGFERQFQELRARLDEASSAASRPRSIADTEMVATTTVSEPSLPSTFAPSVGPQTAYLQERRLRTLVLSGFPFDTDKQVIKTAAERLLLGVPFKAIIVPAPFAQVAFIHFHSIKEKEDFHNVRIQAAVAGSPDFDASGNRLFWNNDRDKAERLLASRTSKARKALIAGGVAATDVKGNYKQGVVWVKGRRVLETTGAAWKALDDFSEVTGISKEQFDGFLALEEKRV